MKRDSIFFTIILASIITLGGFVHAETISLNLVADSYEIMKDREGYDRITIEGYRPMGVPGEPTLPRKNLNILVPPDIDWDSLKLTVVNSEKEVLMGTYAIRPATPDMGSQEDQLWRKGKNIINGKNMAVYGRDDLYPAEYVNLLPHSQMRKWKYTRVAYCPFQYNPVTEKLHLLKRVEVEINFQRSADRASPALLGDEVMDHLAPGLFYNYESGKNWYAPLQDDDRINQVNDYVIITTNDVAGGSSEMSNFIAHKKALGHSVLVVTETDFDPLTGQPPNRRAEKIRQWLVNNYTTRGIEYVLLIGDPTPYESGGGDIPMKMCWPRRGAGSEEQAPTDAFFADLTGNWDLDGDQYYGEWSDYSNPGGVDFAMEVWVGRIPVYGADYATLDNILLKIMDYETQADTSWRQSLLLPMSFSDSTYDGAPLAEQMMDDYLNVRTYSAHTLYQQGSGACSLDSLYPSDEELCGGTVVRDRWAAGQFGIVGWWGHGSATSASVGCSGCWDGTLFNNGQTSALDDNHPSFTYQCSCTNAYPEHSNNLAYAILKEGGIGSVSASRVSWFNIGVGYGHFDGSSTNSGIGYEYVDRLTQELSAGEALYAAKLAVVPDIWANTRLMNQYDFNLYGDPSTGLGSGGSLWYFGPIMNYARYGLDAIEHNGKIYAIGGWDEDTKIEVLDVAGGSWVELQPLPNSQAGVAAALVGNKIYTMGHYGGSNICQIYNIDTDMWQTGPDIPGELYWATAEAVGNKIYLIGGWQPGGQGVLDTLYILDTLTDTWTQGSNLPTGIQIPASAAYGNQIFVFDSGVCYKYDIATDDWSPCPAPPSGHGNASEAVTVGNRIYLIGGNFGNIYEAFKTVEIYDPVSETWTAGPELNVGRYQFGGEYANGRLYAIGGRDANAQALSSVEVLELSPCPCDLNHNGACNILDYQLFIQDWGRTNCGTPPGSGDPPNDCECDLNHDGNCNILDYQIFIQDWGRDDCP
jgi:hypothetical protein